MCYVILICSLHFSRAISTGGEGKKMKKMFKRIEDFYFQCDPYDGVDRVILSAIVLIFLFMFRMIALNYFGLQ